MYRAEPARYIAAKKVGLWKPFVIQNYPRRSGQKIFCAG